LVFSVPPPVTDGTFVYYVSEYGVEAAPVSPSSAGTKPTLLATESPFEMGIYGQNLLLFLSGGVQSLPLGASAAESATTLATGLPNGGLAAAACGGEICWLNEPYSVLMEIDPASGATRQIANLSNVLGSTNNMVSDGTALFIEGGFDPSGARTIVRMSNDGAPPLPVVTLADGGGTLAVDDECVYFSSPTGISSLAKTTLGAHVP
jgi:hypothetical protein